MAIFDKLSVRSRDEFEIAMVPQCSSYCMSQENGIGTQLQLVVQQWAQNVMVKEDIKAIKIASDLRKQVKNYILYVRVLIFISGLCVETRQKQ